MSKQQTESEKPTGFVVMPDGKESTFKLWWKSVPDDHSVNVCYPHEKRATGAYIKQYKSGSTANFPRFC